MTERRPVPWEVEWFARSVFSRATAEQQARITKAADEAKAAQSEAAAEGSCGDGYEQTEGDHG